MADRDPDILPCCNTNCRVKWQCLRYQIAAERNPGEPYIMGHGFNGCEFEINVN